MKNLLRHSRLTTVVALLAISGLVIAAGPVPAAHAGSDPTITASGGAQVVYVNGTGFTPSGSVRIEIRVYNAITKKWNLESKTYVKALGGHIVCHTYSGGTICGWDAGGEISADLISQPGTVHVVAYDTSSATWSNTVTTIIYPIP